MPLKLRLRKWGNSFGVVIPSEFIKKKNLKSGEEIIIEIERGDSIKNLFGSLKDWGVNSQKEKDRIREENE